jgi:hypothetical protein
MTLTQRQADVLNHVVVDAQAWADKAPQKSIVAKVAKWESDYDSAVLAGDYKSRATRDAEELANDPRNPDNWTDLEHWKNDIRKTDSGMPRYMEDLITANSDFTIPEKMKTRYDEKIALRATKP